MVDQGLIITAHGCAHPTTPPPSTTPPQPTTTPFESTTPPEHTTTPQSTTSKDCYDEIGKTSAPINNYYEIKFETLQIVREIILESSEPFFKYFNIEIYRTEAGIGGIGEVSRVSL